jgi:hypothetical protein
MGCAGSNWGSGVLHGILLEEDGILQEANGDVLVTGGGVSLLATIQIVAVVIDSRTEKIDAVQQEAFLVGKAGVEEAGMASAVKVEGSNREGGSSPVADSEVDDVAAPLVCADGQVMVVLLEGRDDKDHQRRMGFSKTSCEDSAVAVHKVLHTAGNVEWENDGRNMWTYESQDFELH